MPKNTKLKVAAGIGLSFMGLAVLVVYLSARRVISFQMALLMLIGMLGMYLGFGVLIAVYRFIGKLE